MDFGDKSIVLLVADTLSAFHLPFHGYDRETAPFMAELAQQNTYVEYGYANAPWTVPAHASLFSGKLPKDHGTTSESMKFTERSFVEALSEVGRFTLGISTNSLVSEELGFDKGFDSFVSSKMGVITENRGWGSTFQHLQDLNAEGVSGARKYIGFLRSVVEERNWRAIPEGFRYFLWKKLDGARFTDFYEDFGAKDANQVLLNRLGCQEGFFAFVNYMEVHTPYYPPKEIAEEYVGDYKEAINLHDEIDFWDFTFSDEQLGEEEKATLKGLYDAEIRYLDVRIEELYQEVMERDEDTIFIIVGDHGELLGEYGAGGHQFGIWEKLLRVPIIIAGDGVPDTVIEETVSLRELHDFILGEKELEELGSEKVF
ncbi:MAG: sulfatase-like hydrolase/transferase, partial [Candidatus Nanohaloarchaea archaeon]